MGKLGYSSITLTDLTQTLPVSLTLESNLNKNIQIKTGTLYEPDFRKKISPEEDFEGVVITPSLFLGQEDLEIEKNEIYVNPNFNDETRTSGFIYYEIGSTVYKYDKDITTGIYVDLQGRLHIEENLNENTTIEAYIEDFKIETHAYTDPLVSAINPITILLLEEGSSNYQAMIDCSDGREHFEDTNASPITMTASLWKGDEQIPVEQLLYSWDKLGDGDSIVDGNDSFLIVERKSITNREYFTCIITDTATGLTYSASQFIYDFTDIYACDISYNKMPLLTDKNTEIILTTNVWNKGKLLESGKDGFILSYDWFARGIVSEKEVTLIENSIEPTLELNVSGIQELQYQDFVVYCKVYQTDSAGTRYPIAGGTLNIHYTVQYSVKVVPQTFFIPTSNAGFYQGEEPRIYNFTFQLLDSEGNILPYEENKDTVSAGNQDDGTKISLIEADKEKKEWNFNGEIDFTNSTLWEPQTNLTSQIYEFTYTYLGQEFSEEINIVKSYVGEQGFSGYTIDLSNNFHAFPGGESIADPGEIVETDISAFYGDKNLEILEVKVNNNGDVIYSSNGENTPVPETNVKNLLISARLVTEDNSIRITMKTGERGSSATTEGNTLAFIIKVKHPEKNETLDILKTFTYIINYEGKSYYLSTDYNNIMYSEANGTYEPSPSQGINVYSLYRGEKGEALTYEIGKIIYSLDEGKTWNYLGGSSGRITNYSGLKNIQIRLYGSASTVDNNPNDLKNNEKYLYDRETIPVLTSLEGYEIGGENLLQWSKTIPLEANKWRTSGEEYLTIEKDGDFSIMNFNTMEEGEDDRWYCFVSPKISLTSDMIGKQYCLSFLFYGENLENFNNQNHFSFELASFKDFNSTTRDAFGVIGYISGNKENSDYLSSEELENSKWCRIYKTFTLDENFFNRSDNKIDTNEDEILDKEVVTPLEECKYLSVYFFMKNKGKVKIKKPKLEMGNIPTAWSLSPDDIDYSDIIKENLIQGDSFLLKIPLPDYKEGFLLSENLLPKSIYTYSFEKSYWEGTSKSEKKHKIQIIGLNGANEEIESEIIFDDKNDSKQSHTFSTKELLNYKLKVFPFSNEIDSSKNGELFLEKIRLEQGSESSSYILSEEYLNQVIKNLEKSDSNTLVLIEGINGTLATEIGDLKETISGLSESYIKIDDRAGIIEAAKSGFLQGEEGTFLTQLQGKITMNSNESDPYIEICQSVGSSRKFSTRIDSNSLGFYDGSTIVAEISSSTLDIKRGHFSNSLSIGDLNVAITESGVGFLW